MRAIHKGLEPPSLSRHRSSQHADYANYPDKDNLRAALVAEQRGLCCYCLSRIRPTGQEMKIAHWHSRGKYPSEQLDYSNLLGACKGGEGQPRIQQHCDTRQANKDLSRNPANLAHRVEDFIRFEGDGRVLSENPSFDTDLNEVLNLNTPFLINNRKATLDAFIHVLPTHGPLPPNQLRKWLRAWNGETTAGELHPFCLVVVYWLRKRLARL
ncbi:MAG TPA: retron system putative HNH endonuclease [Bryobacteraceae bacterium]|nr:retron system putative HNH endonuclease [Bryobacteraceae bacterium]